MAVKKYKKTTPLTEEVIVDIIINWRLGEDSNSDLDSVDEELGVVKAEASTKTPLKQDNIAPEEVVVSWSYKDYRVAKKIEQTVKRKVIKIDYGLEEGGETTK
ncbi:unnamed protein product [Rhizophagus irregularis]|uniref:Uncharacterized protein n=1 Tax=Rhizophagus irregularis TaxID=588596 RepID=A0A915ZMA6_9GLOM|nr:unnamed protein product [Rhizophagus irregularis]